MEQVLSVGNNILLGSIELLILFAPLALGFLLLMLLIPSELFFLLGYVELKPCRNNFLTMMHNLTHLD